MEKNKTPLALAIEQIKKFQNNNLGSGEHYNGKDFAYDECIDILENLKPKEREMFEDFVACRNSTTNIGLNIREMFDKNLTQE